MGTMPTSSALPRTTPDDVPERLLVLPAAQDVAGTPYAHARRLAEQAVADVGGTVVAEGDASATALLMVRPIPVEALAAALAAHPHVSWVQFPFAGIEPFIPLVRSRPDIVWTSAKGTYAPPVAEHALLLTLALLRDLPARVRATTWAPPPAAP